jgi:hypothetical protein
MAVHLAAFGKHPAWDDHIPDLGVATSRLSDVKRLLYVEGIGRNIDTGAWDLAADRVVPQFHHAFAWFQGNAWILGRLWSSTDGKGRSQYPMAVCAECPGLDFHAAGPIVFEQIEQVEASCRQTASPAEVTSILRQATERIRTRLTHAPAPASSPPTRHALLALARRPELGDARDGLVRLLYRIDRENAGHAPWSVDGGPRIASVRPHHIRVPRCAREAFEGLVLWSDFLSVHYADAVPRWVLCPLHHEWVDLLIGAPSVKQFRCLRLTAVEEPLTTDIPYQIDPAFVDRARRLIA